MDDYFKSTYHLHQRHKDLMRERDHDRLITMATAGQPGLLRQLMNRWSVRSTRIMHQLIEADTAPVCTDTNLVEPKSVI